jgi:hypothetical protein
MKIHKNQYAAWVFWPGITLAKNCWRSGIDKMFRAAPMTWRTVFPMEKQQIAYLYGLGGAAAWRSAGLLLGICLWVAGGAALAAEAVFAPAFVAGTAPGQRRADVPMIEAAPPLDPQRALHGVARPYPASLDMLRDQGAWYTPFTQPGMTGRYDIRGYHRQ